MDKAYYLIKDLNLVGKEEDYIPYIFKNGEGWCVDSDRLLTDRIMGYDGDEEKASPYKIGNTDAIELIEEISEEKAMELIGKMIDHQ